MSERRGERRGVRSVHISEAAEVLGVSKDAVRMRIRRGTLESEKGEDGRVYVYLNADHERDQYTVHPETQRETSELVDELRDRLRFVERQLEAEQEARRRADTIIAQLTQANAALTSRIPQLEAPHDSEDQAQKPPEEPEGVEEQGEPEKRSWWRRMFGGG